MKKELINMHSEIISIDDFKSRFNASIGLKTCKDGVRFAASKEDKTIISFLSLAERDENYFASFEEAQAFWGDDSQKWSVSLWEGDDPSQLDKKTNLPKHVTGWSLTTKSNKVDVVIY